MCGIAGVFSFAGAPVDRERLARMGRTLAHRGPDGRGLFTDGPVGLAHRRLAIVDRSERAAQPMVHPGTGCVLSVNGEIYNFIELRKELLRAGESFRSEGDAEVLLAGLATHGMEFLSRVDGDFAFAFWNPGTRRLFLARDRLGVKPLYLYTTPTEVLFASELRALFAAGARKELRPEAIGEYLRFRYVSGEQTMFAGVRALEPGEWHELGEGTCRTRRYWTPNPQAAAFRSYEEGVGLLAEALQGAVSRRLRADVGTGLLLSGGIDSTLIAHLADRAGARDLHAVTYDVPGSLSETEASSRTARELGLTHHVVRPSGRFFELLPEVVRSLELPLGDSIIVPVYELFRDCARHMKVVLSGEGADEIFAGYAHHRVLRNWSWLEARGLRPALSLCAGILRAVPSPILQALVPYPAKLNEEGKTRVALILRSGTLAEAYDHSRALMSSSEARGLLDPDIAGSLAGPDHPPNAFEEVLARDLGSWLPDYGLLRTDKLSMAHGLECRVPYLNHEVVELALSLTRLTSRSLSFQEKKPLRDSAARAFPRTFTSWPRKRPFFFPVERITPRELAEACERYLSPSEVRRTGMLSADGIRELREQPLSFLGGKKLVSLIVLQTWLKEQFHGSQQEKTRREQAIAPVC